jgi:hypothetical protein
MGTARGPGPPLAATRLLPGWDLHPGQLPTRFAATFAFFQAGLPTAAERLRAYREHRSTGVLDEPATATALSDFLRRAVHCGAATSAEVTALAGGPLTGPPR